MNMEMVGGNSLGRATEIQNEMLMSMSGIPSKERGAYLANGGGAHIEAGCKNEYCAPETSNLSEWGDYDLAGSLGIGLAFFHGFFKQHGDHVGSGALLLDADGIELFDEFFWQADTDIGVFRSSVVCSAHRYSPYVRGFYRRLCRNSEYYISGKID